MNVMLQHAIDLKDDLTKLIKKSYKVDITRNTRKRDVVEFRAIAYNIINGRGVNDYTIAKAFGKNHATVLHSKKLFMILYETDKFFREAYNKISERYEVKSEDKLECISCIDAKLEYNKEVAKLKYDMSKLNDEINVYKSKLESYSEIVDIVRHIPASEMEAVKRKLKTYLNGVGGKVYQANLEPFNVTKFS